MMQRGWTVTEKTFSGMSNFHRFVCVAGLLMLGSCGSNDSDDLADSHAAKPACIVDLSKWFPGIQEPPNRVAHMQVYVNGRNIMYNDRKISEDTLYEEVKKLRGLEPGPYINLRYRATRQCITLSRIASKIDHFVDCREARCFISAE
jgi:hypothetical protein